MGPDQVRLSHINKARHLCRGSMTYPSHIPFSPGKDFASLQIFQDVAADSLRDLMSSAHTAQFQKSAVILAQGAPVSRTYIVLEGWCGASRGNVEGQESLLQLFRHGDVLDSGHEAPSDISSVNLLALTPVRLLGLAPGVLRIAMERSHALTANLLRTAARASHELRDHIEQLTLHTAEQRVGRFLLQMLFQNGAEGKGLVLPFDKAHIAAYLNIKPETFSRELQRFRKRGFVIERNHITLPFREALCAYCDKVLMQACPHAAEGLCRLAVLKETPST